MAHQGSRDVEGTCLIAGCGYVGRRLAQRMKLQGPVLGLVRTEGSAEALLREGIPARAVTFASAPPGEWFTVPPGLRSVVYLAPPSGSGVEDLGLRAFLSALGPAHPGVLLYISTTGVYGDTGGAPVDENSPVVPREDRARQRLEAEGQVGQWCTDRAVRSVVFRVPAIYGPYRLPLERLQRGEPVLRSEDSGPGNRIQVDDLVDACLVALERPVVGVFNLTDGQPVSMADFTTHVAFLAGLPVPPRITWTEARGRLSPGLLSFLRESRRVTSGRTAELGWAPRYTNIDDGIRASLAEMGWTSMLAGNPSSAIR